MPALTADGKRIRGANSNADGAYFDTVTLVTHGGQPLASRCCRDEGGETAYGITSVTAERADPERLLAWNRGHWQVENGNHYRRDATMGEDVSRVRARHAPANSATLSNITLAVVFHRGFRYLPEANLHFMMRRRDALDAILEPAERPPDQIPTPNNPPRRPARRSR